MQGTRHEKTKDHMFLLFVIRSSVRFERKTLWIFQEGQQAYAFLHETRSVGTCRPF